MRHGFDVVRSIVRLIVEDKPLTMLGIPGILCLILFGYSGWMSNEQ